MLDGPFVKEDETIEDGRLVLVISGGRRLHFTPPCSRGLGDILRKTDKDGEIRGQSWAKYDILSIRELCGWVSLIQPTRLR